MNPTRRSLNLSLFILICLVGFAIHQSALPQIPNQIIQSTILISSQAKSADVYKTPTPSPTPTRESKKIQILRGEAMNCVAAGDYYSSPAYDLSTVSLGNVTIEQAYLPDGAPVPLSVEECSGDRSLDVFVPWSGATASGKATIHFSRGICFEQTPTAVNVVLLAGADVTLSAYDNRSELVDMESAAGSPEVQTLSLNSRSGIRRIEIEGSELCILSICWQCPQVEEPSPTPTPTPTETSSPTEIIQPSETTTPTWNPDVFYSPTPTQLIPTPTTEIPTQTITVQPTDTLVPTIPPEIPTEFISPTITPTSILPTPTPRIEIPTPIQNRETPLFTLTPVIEGGNCVETSQFYTSSNYDLKLVSLGSVEITTAFFSDGTPIPIILDDITGDGQMEIIIPWSDATAYPKAKIWFVSNICPEVQLPKTVEVVLQAGSNTKLIAYDSNGELVDAETVSGDMVLQSLYLCGGNGIRSIEIEGAEIFIHKICWWCSLQQKPTLTPTPPPTPTEVVISDTTPGPRPTYPVNMNCIDFTELLPVDPLPPNFMLHPLESLHYCKSSNLKINTCIYYPTISWQDCTGDGINDVLFQSPIVSFIKIDFKNICNGKNPERIQFIVNINSSALLNKWRAGNKFEWVDSVDLSSTPKFPFQTVTLTCKNGIDSVFIILVKANLCISKICWQCELPISPSPTPTIEIPTPTSEATVLPRRIPAESASTFDEIVLSQGFGGQSLVTIRNTNPLRMLTCVLRSFTGAPGKFLESIGGGIGRAAYISKGDLDNDGCEDIVVTLGPITGRSQYPSIVIPRNGKTLNVLGGSFTAFPPGSGSPVNYNVGEVRTAVGDFIGSGRKQIAAAQGYGGNGVVRLFQYTGGSGAGSWQVVGQFDGLAGPAKLGNANGGMTLAAGDLDNDGQDELIVGQTNSPTSQTLFQVLNISKTGNVVSRIPYAGFIPKYRGNGGIELAVADLNGDGIKEIIAASQGNSRNLGDERDNVPLNLISVVVPIMQNSEIAGFKRPRGKNVVNLFDESTNPSGSLSIAAGEFSGNPFDGEELIVGTGSLLTIEGMNITPIKPAPQSKYKLFKLVYDGAEVAGVVPWTGSAQGLNAFVDPLNPDSGAVYVAAVKPCQERTTEITPTPTLQPTAIPGNQPELELIEFSTIPQRPRIGEEVTYEALVRNLGNISVNNVKVRFQSLADDGSVLWEEYVTIERLAAGEEKTVQVGALLTKREIQKVKVTVDPENLSKDPEPLNNEAIADINDLLQHAKAAKYYSAKEAFLISDDSWREVLQLVPLTVWTNPKSGTIIQYPALIYHRESKLIIEVDPSGKIQSSNPFDADAVIHFLQQYKPSHLSIMETAPYSLSKLLAASEPTGASIPVSNITQYSMNDYLSFWCAIDRVVVSEDNYETGLMASVLASYLNAPLLFDGQFNYATLDNRYVYTVGKLNANTLQEINQRSKKTTEKSQFTLSELRKTYISLTKTNKVILVNPDDLNTAVNKSFTSSKSGAINQIHYKHSLAAPFLAAAKHEVIITTKGKNYLEVDYDVESALYSLNLSGPLTYLTIVANPRAIPMDRENRNTNPALWGNRVAFEEIDYSKVDTNPLNLTVVTYNPSGNAIKEIIADIYGAEAQPAIYQDKVVWQDYSPANTGLDIYLYDLTQKQQYTITTNSNQQMNPAMSGNWIVWQDNRNKYVGADNKTKDNWDIYVYDLTTKKEIQITTNKADQMYPAISGNLIVWQDDRNGNWDIYGYDLSTQTEFLANSDSGDQQHPAIDGLTIVWQDDRNRYIGANNQFHSNWDIYMAIIYYLPSYIPPYLPKPFGSGSLQITKDKNEQWMAGISGDHIVWHDNRNGNWDVYMYTISNQTEKRLTLGDNHQIRPRIQGDHVIWYSDGITGTPGTPFLFMMLPNVNSSLTYFYEISTGKVSQYANLLTHENSTFRQETDGRYYGSINNYGYQDRAVGRIYGFTVSDVSAYIARDLFIADLPKNRDALLIVREDWQPETKDHVTDGPVLENYARTTYWTPAVRSQFDDEFFFSGANGPHPVGNNNPIIRDLYDECYLILYADHGGKDGFPELMTTGNLRPSVWLMPSTILDLACSTCDTYAGVISPDNVFCLENMRRGAMVYMGAVDVSYWHRMFDNILTGCFINHKTIGECYVEARNEEYKNGVLSVPFGLCGDSYYTLLGDPTFKPRWW